MISLINWTFVTGGICAYEGKSKLRQVKNLFWTTTPITWDQAQKINPKGNQSEPITFITHDDATQFAEQLGARLPTSLEWEWMASGPEHRRYPWGNVDWTPDKGNLRLSGIGHPTSVGLFLSGATPEGILDVAGNIWEWTDSQIPNSGIIIRGGSYNSPVLYIQSSFVNEVPRELSSGGIGMRLVKDE